MYLWPMASILKCTDSLPWKPLTLNPWNLCTLYCNLCSFFVWIRYKNKKSRQIFTDLNFFFFNFYSFYFSVEQVLIIKASKLSWKKSGKFPRGAKLEAFTVSWMSSTVLEDPWSNSNPGRILKDPFHHSCLPSLYLNALSFSLLLFSFVFILLFLLKGHYNE